MTLREAILLYARDSRDEFTGRSWTLCRRVQFLRSSGRRAGIEQIEDDDIRNAYFMVMDASRDDIIAALAMLGENTSEM